ncbi:dihydropteroate synthase [Microbacterium sp. UFMG61]|uniref:dihydropteroate synthase n=1 Tax=Microbacterium sp. UFMG61 TaxID=2745935 RepID=UPI00188DF3DC|nr:dihydropteroate synthase [Microbacterium sp. UFMG61]
MTGIWGIVNVTPDSFSDGGRYLDVDRAVAHGLRLRAEGATVLDIGGESTRPGAERVGPDVEQERVLPVIEQLVAAGAPVSIDTFNAATATAAVRAGARIVNDVSGGLADPDMLAAVAETGADYAIGHWRGFSSDMYAQAEYRRVAREVAGELKERMGDAAAAGIAPSRLIVDPGIGFAKAGAQNWELLRGLDEIVALGPRVLIGTSRKRFLAETLRHAAPEEEASEPRRDLATAVTSALAARAGVWAVRVHDVAATRDALAIAHAWEG